MFLYKRQHEVSVSAARFDYDGDGYRELTDWAGKDDGLLVYDIGNDGGIIETREVVISDWTADNAKYAKAA